VSLSKGLSLSNASVRISGTCPGSLDRLLSALDLRLTDPDFWLKLDTMNGLVCVMKPTRSSDWTTPGDSWSLCMDS